MDDQRFDRLSRRLATFASRRQALKSLAAGAAAAVLGNGPAEAQSCTQSYRPCQTDGQCCAGAVCQYGMCTPGCRIGGQFASASTPQPGNTCARCAPAISTTNWSSANEGMSCWSGGLNLCGGPSTCQAGACQPTNAVTCQPLTPCHLAGECNPATGLCSNPPAPAGIACGSGPMCLGGLHTPGLTCDGKGACVGGQTAPCRPYLCGATTCAASCQADGDCAPGAHCDDNECLWDEGLGAVCDEDSDCGSDVCAQGVCCETRCDEACRTCSAATGGRCVPTVCDDGLNCTTGACDSATNECEFSINAGRCLIDGECYASGDVNRENACESCQPGVDQRAWSSVLCNDGLACTTDSCDPATGCRATLDAGHCLIGDACHNDGALNPADPCQVCDANSAPRAWTDIVCDDGLACTVSACAPDGMCVHPVADGACLIDGDTCHETGDVNDENACQICDPGRNPHGWSTVICNDGLTCTTDACDPETGCVATLDAGHCLIDDVNCYNDGAPHPADPCQVCAADSAPRAWSNVVCDDGLVCTVSACAADGTCVHPVADGACLIDGECYQTGDINTENTCQICDPEQNQRAWSDVVCNDGLACTTDTCHPVTGCGATLDAGHCLIDDEVCYDDGALSPEDPCQMCDADGAPRAWSDVACDDGLACTTGACNSISGQCEFPVNMGHCLIDGECYEAGDVNQDNACESCQPTANQRVWSAVVCNDGLACTTDICHPITGCGATIDAGYCLIEDDICYDDGTLNPANPCQICNASVAPRAWSAVVCDDGLSCTTGTCNGVTGQCEFPVNAGRCLIDGDTCYEAGDVNDENACKICDPDRDQRAWSAVICSDGFACTTDTCDPAMGCGATLGVGHCLIADVCYDDDALNPENLCQVCDADADAHEWTDVVCDDGLECTVSMCAPDGACVHVVVAGACSIEGECFNAGARRSEQPCQLCDPERSQTEWSDEAAGTICAETAGCSAAGVITLDGVCDASGTCLPGATTSCAPFACTAALTCESACTSEAQCAAGASCCEGACVMGACPCPAFNTRNSDGDCVSPCALGSCGSCNGGHCGARADGTGVCMNGTFAVTCTATCTTTPPPGCEECLHVWSWSDLEQQQIKWCSSGACVDFQGGYSLPVCYSPPS